MKAFNVTGLCLPEEDYMVDISGKIKQIKELVDRRSYFAINRARQYGKTTTLEMLKRELDDEYLTLFISFEGLGDESFSTELTFCDALTKLIRRALSLTSASEEYSDSWLDPKVKSFMSLHGHITKQCKDRKIVLMIDEVDKVSNNLIFMHFLSMLRDKFLARKRNADYTFHSVILAGVYDIKNIKLKLASEGLLKPETSGSKMYNSPWNIAADFNIDMSFSPVEISTMLGEYEGDHKTGMDILAIADEIYSHTNGYPFLVSRICQHIDEKLGQDWTSNGIQEAVKIMLAEKNTLFDDVFKNLENSRELYDFIHGLLLNGEVKYFVIHNPLIATGDRYGFFCNKDGKVAISNRIFELLMTDYFISKDLENNKQLNSILQIEIVKGGRFDMEKCLHKFAEHYSEVFTDDDTRFLEKHGRLVFLSYLKPLINGAGFYHIESQFTNLQRMDLVVDYGRDQFILELKIWRGDQYEKQALEQLCGYLDRKRADTGYLLTFDFRKVGGKALKAEWLEINGKRIFTVSV